MTANLDGYRAVKSAWLAPPREINANRFPLTWIDDVKPKLDSQYIVKGLLSSGALSVVYGESGSGKTFAALSIALHVALGWAWRELQTTQCGALYIACEGGGGALNRVAAFKAYHPNYASGLKAPFAMITAPINLLDPKADVADLVECIRDAEKHIGRPIGLIVIDTLSRALAGGEENSSQDMGAFVANVDRVRAETGAHVLIVHHSGKDQARGARGHSLLRAATDTEIEVTSDEATGIRRMVVRKQRDLPTDGEFAFRLVSLDLGIDQDGEGGMANVPYDGAMIQGHAKEMMLPASIAQPLRESIASGNLGGGGGSSGDTHNWDFSGAQFGNATQGQIEDAVVSGLTKAVRKGRFA